MEMGKMAFLALSQQNIDGHSLNMDQWNLLQIVIQLIYFNTTLFKTAYSVTIFFIVVQCGPVEVANFIIQHVPPGPRGTGMALP